jgi:signal transduction histidine kinase
MTYTGKIRGYLILVALISPVLIMLVIYFHSIRQLDKADENSGLKNLEKFNRYHDVFKAEMVQNARELIVTPLMRRVIHRAKSSGISDPDISGLQTNLDFVEILNDSGKVRASYHRPGLIGQYINDNFRIEGVPDSGFLETEEYDINGRHAAFTQISSIDSSIFLYTGKYIDSAYIRMVEELTSARVYLWFPDDTVAVERASYKNMRCNQLYQIEDMMLAILAGGEISDFFLTAEFESTTERALFRTLLEVAGVVALVSILIAIFLGWLITGRIKREIDNLIAATSQIAAGDLTTPVISYEAGEFMQLANSFSKMKSDLKQTRTKLVTSEKIAAWKAIGQKIAHEVKNPLTPISISIDDLQKSYYEKLPDFDKTLDETVDVIKVEIKRLTKMLDQFAAFARMAPPVIGDVKPAKLIDDINALYKREVDSGKLQINNSSQRNIFRIDHERIRQLLINLIKNSFESSPETSVRIDFSDAEKGVEIKIEDNGPGFPDNILKAGFKPYGSNKEGGSGLGLVICQRIVYDSGGTIELYNRKEGGAGLIIDLPFDNG